MRECSRFVHMAGMGIPRPKDLSDLIRLKANLRISCPKCGRSGVFLTRDVIAYFRSKNWNSAWQAAGERFRCEGFGKGCGHKGALLSLAPIEEPFKPPVPKPTERDRREEIRRRRG